MTLAAERESEVVYPDPTPPVLGGFQGLPSRPGWFSQHLGTAAVLAVGGLPARPLARQLDDQRVRQRAAGRGERRAGHRRPAAGVLGWLLGIGALNYPLAKMVGMEPRPDYESTSWTRYFRYTADHKVVGLQYVIGVLGFLFTGGLLAMAIRTELLSPDQPRLRPRHLHLGRQRARHGHDDDGHLGYRRPPGQLAGAADDRGPTHGIPPGGGLQLLGLHRRLPGHPVGPVLRRLPHRLDRATPRCRPRPAWP